MTRSVDCSRNVADRSSAFCYSATLSAILYGGSFGPEAMVGPESPSCPTWAPFGRRCDVSIRSKMVPALVGVRKVETTY